MDNLQTNDLIALSLLLDEEIYLIRGEQIDGDKAEALKIGILDKTITEGPIEINNAPVKAAALETEVTVIPATNKAGAVAQAKPAYKYLGDNNKYLLIIVNEPSFEFLNKKDLDFLTKILGAKKWAINDIAIVNLAKYNSLDFDELKTFFGFNKLITFGINPKILNVEGAVSNKKCMFKDVAILGTWDLFKLAEDVKKKTTFWNELKTF
ncbi:hypothetical protein I5M32_15305 [Pedobacter sp. SD-b]|uniref:Uncharacterized protein n=1 Tax=Pedobacter segetis TaxID=2793069 RepID=A0ABS1BN58_9SPHI|nr:hypothetical protein [Pedobacter segetis]MBK0384334.1 hypothetical protein [Pedobacter segetis]